MSEREAMTQKVVAYHNEQARGASFEWHARCATHVENQEQIIEALADYIQAHGGHEGGCGAFDGSRFIGLTGCTCPLGAALRLAGRL